MTDEARGPDRSSPSSDELLRLVVESATDFAIVAMDRKGFVASWNAGAERMLGYTEAEILGRDGDVIFTPEDRESGEADRERHLAFTQGRAENERWHIRKDGSRFWGSGLLMRLADGSGSVKIMRDLTERRAAQEQIREREELFALLATNIPQLVFRTRGNGDRVWGSPQWIVFTGLSFDESVGFGWLNAVHAEDRGQTVAAWDKAQETGDYYIEHRIRRSSDGEYRWHQTRAKPVNNDRRSDDWVGTSSDVHDLRGLQDRQKVLLAELHHRTRNLLAVVQAIARQTIRTKSTLEAFAGEFEGRLRALSRVQGLLARVDHGAVNLRELVEAELKAHGNGGTELGRVTIEGPPALLPASSAQALALAVHELATNAVKYGAFKHPSGKLSVAWRIEDGGDTERRVVLEWRESGVEMPDTNARIRKGYGSELIERALPYQLNAETHLEFGPDGVRFRIATAVENEEGTDG